MESASEIEPGIERWSFIHQLYEIYYYKFKATLISRSTNVYRKEKVH